MHPIYQGARFLTAAARLEQCPVDQGREVAFSGRSNAGKSSVINTICHQNALARTSKTPGRTQQMVFFQLDDSRRLVDLPGYGYAKVPEALKRDWQTQMSAYLEQRRSLVGLVLVMDIRHPLTEFDQHMLRWGGRANLPILALLTKADKLKSGAVRTAERMVERVVTAEQEANQVATFSSLRRHGVGVVHHILDRWLEIDPVAERSTPQPTA
ncbi:YihA family ribosome biogenesis GTP-binding protein [Thiocapsa imhoffii]|uniref:Probable GTP-binding protein EngB n=1 Tax=Thiocapsa imhoffii TaxID=382777 RepID=A0A9X1B7B1_9GAMM|nr:ribosome biogenesis GTP-binding protein YihA/YsxC [Thiocapsa imhoffii]MBK1643487.1 YihA family ribosome biogenesis GTP-binding protein [Thiocapsa imhoffii]